MSPRVRAVVLNFNGGADVLEAVAALRRTDWPASDLDVVVVDNASTDGSDAAIASRFEDVTLVPTGRNTGFPANNVAMEELAGLEPADHVALVNNDAFVEPGWLRPLVDALEADAGLGAACPRIVFAPEFVDVELTTEVFVPGGGDPRTLGVQLTAVEVDGADVWRDAQRVDGFWGIEPGPDGDFEWTDGRAHVRLPVDPGHEGPVSAVLTLASATAKEVVARSGDTEVRAVVGPGRTRVEVEAHGTPFDVVNNVGSVLVDGGYGADRGYLDPDDGRYDEPEEVFAWCGGGVLLRRAYLDEVGLFDPRFFLYYEDTDLAWRGRSRGWRYRYVPESRIRHIHAASTGEGSPVFQHFVERNRLLMLVKNAPARLAATAVGRYVLTTASYARRDVVAPVRRGHRPNLGLVRRRIRSFLGFLRLLPAMLLARRANRQRQVVADDELVGWMVER